MIVKTFDPNYKNLCRLFYDVQSELDAICIPYGEVSKLEISNTRAWGDCRKLSDGTYRVRISKFLLENAPSDNEIKNTIAHELLHTISGCMNHGTKWKMYAKEVNDCYSFYNIKRTTSTQEKHIDNSYVETNYKYKVVCNKCGHEWLYMKKCSVVKVLETHMDRDRLKCPYCENYSFNLKYNN